MLFFETFPLKRWSFMANPESVRPGDNEAEAVDVGSVVESGTIPRHEEQALFCSPGVRSPLIDRIMGGHFEVSDTNVKGSVAKCGHDEFWDRLKIFSCEDASIVNIHQRASECGLPMLFLEDKINSNPKSLQVDYYRFLGQLIDLVLFYAEKEQGRQEAVRPFGLSNKELIERAREVAAILGRKPEILVKIKTLKLEVELRISQPGNDSSTPEKV